MPIYYRGRSRKPKKGKDLAQDLRDIINRKKLRK